MVRKVVIIPSRFDSSRFPGKPLAIISGSPMVQHVWERAKCIAGIDEVVVATDSQIILDAVSKAGVFAVMTSPDHKSGTDRVAEVAEKLSAKSIVLNVQGDLPFVDIGVCEKLIQEMENNPKCDIATPVIEQDATNTKDFYDRNIVKAVFDKNGRALYFTRKSVPDIRDCIVDTPVWYRHIGIYCYRNSILQEITKLPRTNFEKYERLEQLRPLEHGYHIQTVLVDNDCGPDINCPEDMRKI